MAKKFDYLCIPVKNIPETGAAAVLGKQPPERLLRGLRPAGGFMRGVLPARRLRQLLEVEPALEQQAD